MKQNSVPAQNRRKFLRHAATVVSGTVLVGTSSVWGGLQALAQDPPSGCPTPPAGGTPFQPGQDKRTIVLRRGIGAMNAPQLAELQSAFTALRGLPANDPRTWLLQADLHALYCQQCFNDSTQIHFMWNFFPWHRAYLYFYERILGSLVNNLDGFRLPYWDWENTRSMPAAYRAPAAATNSLWDQNRDASIEGGGNLPAGDGDMPRIVQLNAMHDFATFGGTLSGAGACEGNPHGVIHNDIGEPTGDLLDMGNLGFAARDPIFFAHHCNIDKLWSSWNALASGSGLPAGAYKNPTDPAFLNATWSFYDENSKVVSIRAADLLDHRTNLRYTYTLPRIHIPPLYEIIPCRLICCDPGPEHEPFLEISPEALQAVEAATRQGLQTALVLREVEIPAGVTGTFDVFAVRGERKVLLGSFAIVGETKMAMKESHRMTLLLDATKALPDIAAKEKPATLRLVGRRGIKAFTLQAKEAELRILHARKGQKTEKEEKEEKEEKKEKNE